jgi:hypothetical protein
MIILSHRKNGHDVEKNIAQELKSILSPDKVVHFLKKYVHAGEKRSQSEK